jgi:hypothetical protein
MEANDQLSVGFMPDDPPTAHTSYYQIAPCGVLYPEVEFGDSGQGLICSSSV